MGVDPLSTITAADADRVREYLATGKTVQQVSELAGLPRMAVLSVIKNTKGWLHDRERDTVIRPAVTDATPDGLGNAPVEDLIAGAAGIKDKAVQRELGKTVEQVARLRQAVISSVERTTAAREVADLERRLAEAKARLKNAQGRRAAGARATDAEVRAWAAERGVECNPHGRVPNRVRDQYEAAHRKGA